MNVQKSMDGRAWAEILLLALIWGGSFLATRVALDEIGPLTTVLHRAGWAAVILWAWVLMRGYDVPRTGRFLLACAGMGLLNNVIPFALMAWGQLHIESGLTAIFNAATAIFGVVAAAIAFTDERLTWNRALGVVLGFFGVATAIGLASFANFDIRSLAQLAIIGGTISYAIAGVWARKMMTGVRPEVAAMGMLTASTTMLLPLAWAVEGQPSLALQTSTWMGIGYVSIIATALAYLLYYRVLASAGSGNLMLVTLLVAPVAIVLGAWARNETLPSQAYLGFALLALGLVVLDGRVFKRFKKA